MPKYSPSTPPLLPSSNGSSLGEISLAPQETQRGNDQRAGLATGQGMRQDKKLTAGQKAENKQQKTPSPAQGGEKTNSPRLFKSPIQQPTLLQNKDNLSTDGACESSINADDTEANGAEANRAEANRAEANRICPNDTDVNGACPNDADANSTGTNSITPDSPNGNGVEKNNIDKSGMEQKHTADNDAKEACTRKDTDLPSTKSIEVAEVVLFTPPFQTLSYLFPHYLPKEHWQVGQRVAVPLGRGVRAGIIVGFSTLTKRPQFTLKNLLWPLEKTPLISQEYCELIAQIALRHISPPGKIFASVLPAGLRQATLSLRVWGEGKPQEIAIRTIGKLTASEQCLLGKQWHNGTADISLTQTKRTERYHLEQNPPWPVRPVAHKQLALLERLLDHGPLTRKKLLAGQGSSASAALNILLQKGLISIKPDEGLSIEEPDITPPPPVDEGFTLTPAQNTVFHPLEAALQIAMNEGKSSTHLLFGVTGSGKTAIYLELAMQALRAGRSTLLLAPEVALAYKLLNDVKTAFPQANHYLYHGYLSPTAREDIFRTIATETGPAIIIGTRSALFLPVHQPALIVLDEEHDGSFKQDEGLSYQAKEIAWYRAERHGGLLILGSATPDIKSFYASATGAIPVHELSERVSGGELPKISLVQLGYQANTATGGLMPESVSALQHCIEQGDQAIILLNRRGYAPLLYCLGCGTVVKCPSCDIGLTYHKGREQLVCHYCGYTTPFPTPCPSCKSLNFLPMGDGTERLEEYLTSHLPVGAGVLRLDRDSTRRQGSMENILKSFARKEAQVLVGTQMLSKGHHFPDVTLAIIADADLGLNLPDYRAAERTFQLIVQSSGRSGRGTKEGQVIIQTRTPNHYCWSYVMQGDYRGFYENELALRKKFSYPPFVRLALIRISHEMQDELGETIVEAVGELLMHQGPALQLTILGPSPAPLPFLKGRKRYNCLIKSHDWQAIRGVFHSAKALVESLKKQSSIRISLDLDPVNML